MPMLESYETQKTQEFAKFGFDYEVFMAIAENIGYDTTGKPTGINDLDFISVELKQIIEKIARY